MEGRGISRRDLCFFGRGGILGRTHVITGGIKRRDISQQDLWYWEGGVRVRRWCCVCVWLLPGRTLIVSKTGEKPPGGPRVHEQSLLPHGSEEGWLKWARGLHFQERNLAAVGKEPSQQRPTPGLHFFWVQTCSSVATSREPDMCGSGGEGMTTQRAGQVGFWTSVCPLSAKVKLSKTEVCCCCCC